MVKSKKREARIELLDDDFNPIPEGKGEGVRWTESTVVRSGNIRVTFSSGAMLDLYVADPDDGLHITTTSRPGFVDELMLVSNNNIDGFTVSVRSIRSKRI